jgi:tRNA threonylcarbamoyladenosine modification (KEOPS) complex  Pcc1 subunit
MSFTSAQLKSELQTDPAALGYATMITARDFAGLNAAINLVRSGTAPDGKSYSVYSQTVSASAIMANINATEWTATVPTTNSWLALIGFMVGGVIDATNTNVRAVFTKIFVGMPNTLSAIDAAAHRNGSRAEALYGTGTTISDADIHTAMGI